MTLGVTIRALVAALVLAATFGVPSSASAHGGHPHGPASERAVVSMLDPVVIQAVSAPEGDHGRPMCQGDCHCVACHAIAISASETTSLASVEREAASGMPDAAVRPDIVPEVLPKPPRHSA